MGNLPFLIAAYAVTILGLAVYIAFLRRQQAQVTEDLREIRNDWPPHLVYEGEINPPPAGDSGDDNEGDLERHRGGRERTG